jgi:hypothetical protein
LAGSRLLTIKINKYQRFDLHCMNLPLRKPALGHPAWLIFFTTVPRLGKFVKNSTDCESTRFTPEIVGWAVRWVNDYGPGGGKAMLTSVGSLKISGLLGALAAMWLWGAGSARAGDGGADVGTIQTFLNTICTGFGVSPCPQLPTISQGVLEVAALVYARPESIRRSQNISPGSVFASNPPPVPFDPPVPVTLPVTPLAFAELALTPLAFISASTRPELPIPTQLYDPDTDTLFSAVTTFGTVQGVPQPQVLNLFYDDLARTNVAFTNGQVIAIFSLPLVVLNSDGSERPVPTKLTIKSCATGSARCLLGAVTGNFLGNGTNQTRSAADIGVSFALVFGALPTLTHSHAIFEVQIPLVVTSANDPVYFSFTSPQSNIIGSPTFGPDDTGFTPTKKGILPVGASIGIAPYPAPTTTAEIPPGPATSTFGFCADLPDNSNGAHARLHPAVATFLAIATDGTTLVSSPTGGSSMPTLNCSF